MDAPRFARNVVRAGGAFQPLVRKLPHHGNGVICQLSQLDHALIPVVILL